MLHRHKRPYHLHPRLPLRHRIRTLTLPRPRSLLARFLLNLSNSLLRITRHLIDEFLSLGARLLDILDICLAGGGRGFGFGDASRGGGGARFARVGFGGGGCALFGRDGVFNLLHDAGLAGAFLVGGRKVR